MYRKATIYDCPNIYDLICDMESKKLPFDRFQKIYCNQLTNEHYYCLVYEQNGSIIAVLNLRFEEQLHHSANIAEIMEFAVKDSNRNQGIGKDMLAQARRISKEHDCVQIEVACNRLRENTHRFYLREGMHNFHFKFSRSLDGNDASVNSLGK